MFKNEYLLQWVYFQIRMCTLKKKKRRNKIFIYCFIRKIRIKGGKGRENHVSRLDYYDITLQDTDMHFIFEIKLQTVKFPY